MVIIMAAAGIYVFNRAVGGGEPVVVPSIADMPLPQAQAKLAEVGLVMSQMRQRESDRVQEGHVITQRPEAGRVVRRGRRIVPTVSQGAVQIAAPNLVGMTIGAADEVLQSQSITELPGARIRHTAARGTIIAQEPAAGQALVDRTIRFLVSEGTSDTILMTDITGKSLDAAQQELRRLDVVGRAIVVDDFNAPLDEVLEQVTPAGSVIAPGQVVLYKVRPSDPSKLENAMREVRVRYTVPHRFFPSRVRAEGVNSDGSRVTPPLVPERELESGSVINFDYLYTGEGTIEFYVDDTLHQTYYYQGGADPVVTTHREEWDENDV